ncbi:DUF305 domain-containing protein [Streptomyces cinnabarinus]|uniref:DUF305 domain-containing protein n=1 Tax=Streptomyces cinnabarinus TaxID=67287 RepID=A0ABY7KNX8_9ACTN|nr:DUF305 domain-containing protein [Streptomyces cinnabarinus]WAZ26278.1 DUF305 domain-containing protein [Streptomyces cinnabarinus]
MTDFVAGGPKKVLLAALLCALAVSGCAGSPQPSRPDSGSRASTSAPPSGLTAADIGWLQLMIAMDDQARHILQLAPERSGSTDLKVWAADVAEHHRSELATLRALLTEGGVPDDNPHEGHDMPGMVNAQELRALETAQGPRFDRLLRSALLEHLAQARKLAASVRTADTSKEVKKAALATGTSAADARRRLGSA